MNIQFFRKGHITLRLTGTVATRFAQGISLIRRR